METSSLFGIKRDTMFLIRAYLKKRDLDKMEDGIVKVWFIIYAQMPEKLTTMGNFFELIEKRTVNIHMDEESANAALQDLYKREKQKGSALHNGIWKIDTDNSTPVAVDIHEYMPVTFKGNSPLTVEMGSIFCLTARWDRINDIPLVMEPINNI